MLQNTYSAISSEVPLGREYLSTICSLERYAYVLRDSTGIPGATKLVSEKCIYRTRSLSRRAVLRVRPAGRARDRAHLERIPFLKKHHDHRQKPEGQIPGTRFDAGVQRAPPYVRVRVLNKPSARTGTRRSRRPLPYRATSVGGSREPLCPAFGNKINICLLPIVLCTWSAGGARSALRPPAGATRLSDSS